MGWQVVREFAERLLKRRGAPLSVRCLGITCGPQGENPPPPPLGAKALNLVGSPDRRAEGPAPLQGQGDQIRRAIVEALAEISGAGYPGGGGLLLAPTEEWVIGWVVPLDDPWAGRALLDAVTLAQELVVHRLGVEPVMLGALLPPDLLDPDLDERALVQSYATLLELGHESSTPAFNAGCYLLGAPPGPSGPAHRIAFIAEGLYQLLLCPLGQVVRAKAESAALLDPTPTCSLFALAAWVYPAEEAVDSLSRRLARELVEALLGEGLEETPTGEKPSSGQGSLAGHDLTPEALIRALLPADLLAEWRWMAPLEVRLEWPDLTRWRLEVEEEMEERLEALHTRHQVLKHRAQEMAKAMAHRLQAAVLRGLDEGSGVLPICGRFQRLMEGIKEAQEGQEEAAEAGFEALEELEGELERWAQRGEELAARIPQSWPALLRLLILPHRWLDTWRNWRGLNRVAGLYSALLHRRLDQVLTIMGHDLVAETYKELIPCLEHWSKGVGNLAYALRAARKALEEEGEEEPGEGVDSGRADGRSLLTAELWQELCGRVATDLDQLLAKVRREEGPVCRWLRESWDRERLAKLFLAQAALHCAPLREFSVEDLILARYPEPEERLEALKELVAAATPPPAFDEAALQEGQGREMALLGVGAPLSPSLEQQVEELPLPLRVILNGDPYRWTILRALHGLPLGAITFVQEAQAAYRRKERLSVVASLPLSYDA